MRRTLRGFMVIFSWFVIPYSQFKCARIKNKRLPPLSSRLLTIPAIELASLIRQQEVRSEDVIRAYTERCNEVNPLINAIVEERFDGALEEARNVDKMIQERVHSVEEMERNTPLLGVPVTIKESIGVKGMSNQAGRTYKNQRTAPEDAPSVELLRRSGAIIILVSNTPELCMQWETFNHVTGLTKNPHNLRRTCGGSSGGEAALLGAGASLLGLSSDVGGSVRLPAMFVGVFGHKPTPYLISPLGHVPSSPASNWGNFFTIAPMCRYACDIPVILKVIADRSLAQNQLIVEKLDYEIDLKAINIYFMDSDGPSGLARPLSRDMRQAFGNAVEFLKAKRHNMKRLKHSFDISTSAMLRLDDLETIFNEKWTEEEDKNLHMEFLKYCCGLSKFTISTILIGYLQLYANHLPESLLERYETITQSLKSDFRQLLGDDGVFLYPCFPTTAHKHFQIFHKLVDTSYLMVFNALGMPVTSAMIGLDRNRMPIGIQIAANPGNDYLTIHVAKELEKKFGGWVPPCKD